MSAAIDTYVESTYIDSAGNLINRLPSLLAGNTPAVWGYATFSKGTESDGTKYRIFKQLDPNLIPLQIWLASDAISGLTSVDCGLYVSGIGGAAKSDNCFASAVDIHAGAATFFGSTPFNMLGAISHYNLYKRLFEYAGDVLDQPQPLRQGGYDLVLTCDTAGTNTGKISVLAQFAIG